MKLQGIFIETTTPFDYKGDVYRVKVEHNVEKWNHTTVAGYVVCGVAGEGALLTVEERSLVWECTAKTAKPGKALIAGVSSEGVRAAAELAKRAASLGYAAVVAGAPSAYSTPDNENALISLFFRSLADQSELPVIARIDAGGISLETIAGVAAHPNIGAIVSAGRTGELKPTLSGDTAILESGADHLLAALQAGAGGAILALASAIPYAAIAIWEAFRTRQEEAAADWQGRIAPCDQLVRRYGIPALKHAMDRNGYYGGPPRLPLSVPTPAVRAQVEEAFRYLKS